MGRGEGNCWKAEVEVAPR